MPTPLETPSWDALFQVASTQGGLFSASQAADAGISAQLLAHHLKAEKIRRVRRAVYRLVQYPDGDHEDLVALWLWSECAGVFGLETALLLHGLSDALPAVTSLVLPASWAARRLRIPAGVRPLYADIPDRERSWVDPVPVTSVLRTLEDCLREGTSDEILAQAIVEARSRGLVAKSEAASLRRRLRTGRE